MTYVERKYLSIEDEDIKHGAKIASKWYVNTFGRTHYFYIVFELHTCCPHPPYKSFYLIQAAENGNGATKIFEDKKLSAPRVLLLQDFAL